MATSFVLILMRHLPTKGNQKRQYIGWTDESILPLSTDLQTVWKPNLVYGSDLRRCVESAHVYFPQATYQEDARLRESFFGDWEGKTYDLLKGNKQYRNWIDHPEKEKPPNGESLQDVERRLVQALDDLPTDQNNHYIVTHGGPIRILLTKYAPEPSDFWSWQIPHGSAWRLEWESVEAFKEGKRCVSLSAVPTTASENM